MHTSGWSDRSDGWGRGWGPPVAVPSRDRQRPSEGATRRAIQVPPKGYRWVGPDHLVTGGYPVVGVVIDEDIDKVAEVRPGEHVRFTGMGLRSSLGPAASRGARAGALDRNDQAVDRHPVHPGTYRSPGSYCRSR